MTSRTAAKILEGTHRRRSKQRWTYVGDLWDLQKLIGLLKANKVKQAARMMYNLDSDARDNLPSRVFDWLGNQL